MTFYCVPVVNLVKITKRSKLCLCLVHACASSTSDVKWVFAKCYHYFFFLKHNLEDCSLCNQDVTRTRMCWFLGNK
jgi:hypothetical protein